MRVSAEAKENKANEAVVETIATFFDLPSKDVLLVNGQKSREKTVCLKKITLDKVYAALEDVFHES